MELICLGSSSTGNSYLLESEKECLLIEAGVPYLEVKKALNFDVSKIKGMLISHIHNDHTKCLNQYSNAGIKIYTNSGTHDGLAGVGVRTIAVKALKRCQIGNFTVIPFNVPHDEDAECYGYLIEHKEIGKLLFMTDLGYCPYNFSKEKVNHIMCECNHSNSILYQEYEGSVRERVLKSHMSLETFLRLVKANDSDNLQNVVLLHLSSVNSDEDLFLEETNKVTSAQVFIAKKGLKIQLTLPF